MLGAILTHTNSSRNYVDTLKRYNYSVAKVVTAWGIGRRWDSHSRTHILQNMSHVIVRTVSGDPSYHSASWYPEPMEVVREIEPWYALRKDILIEIGNEPDTRSEKTGYVEHDVWAYRWYLLETIKAVRRNYPQVKIIGPSPRVNSIPQWQRWIEILQDPLRDCDMLSAHIYGWHNLTVNWEDTAQYVRLRTAYDRLFRDKPVMITEVGIHDVQQTAQHKIAKYHEFYLKLPIHWRGMTIYHYSEAKDIDKEYAVFP
jgi:hypothetical protein